MNKEVTVSLQFDVTVPVTADSDGEAEDKISDMDLQQILEWSGCASYNLNIYGVKDVD